MIFLKIILEEFSFVVIFNLSNKYWALKNFFTSLFFTLIPKHLELITAFQEGIINEEYQMNTFLHFWRIKMAEFIIISWHCLERKLVKEEFLFCIIHMKMLLFGKNFFVFLRRSLEFVIKSKKSGWSKGKILIFNWVKEKKIIY